MPGNYGSGNYGAGTYGDPSGERVAVLFEPPSEQLMVHVTPPGGASERWAADEHDLANTVSGQRMVDEMPGGEKEWSGVLPRDPRADWRDTEPFSELIVKSGTGEVVWGPGQLDKVSESDGSRTELAPAAVGYQAALDDNKAAKLGIIDRDLGRWGEMPTERRNLLEALGIDPDAVSTSTSPFGGGGETSEPASITFSYSSLKGGVEERGELVYDGGGADIGEIRYDFKGRSESPDATFVNSLSLSTDGINAVGGTDHDATTALQQVISAGALKRLRYAIMTSAYQGSGEFDSWVESFLFQNVCVLGDHGLTPRGTWPDIGFTAAQILSYAVPLLAPPLEVGEVEDDEFLIPQAWFSDPTTMGAIVNEVTKYGLLDWYVKGRQFNLRFPGAGARKWQAYVGPSSLREAGRDAQRLWESIVVQWQDVDGSTKTAGPPGSGATFETEALRITDPEHPAVKSPRVRRDLLQFKSVGIASEAIKAGERWLEEANALDRSGDCTLTGYVMDDSGNLWPVSYVRGWDLIRFPDAADKGYRRISRRDYEDDTKALTLSLDAPAEGLEALLERYGAALVPLGL